MAQTDTDPSIDPTSKARPDPTALLADFLIDVVKNREAISAEILQAVSVCETMIQGLPKVVEAMSPDEEGMRLGLGKDLRRWKEEGAPDEFLKWAKEHGDMIIGRILTHTKSVRAIAKTQITLARHLRNMSMLMMIYAVSDSCGTDAAKLASKLGKGDEALKALWRAKFGDMPNF